MPLTLEYHASERACPLCGETFRGFQGAVYHEDCPVAYFQLALHGHDQSQRTAGLAIFLLATDEVLAQKVAFNLSVFALGPAIATINEDWSPPTADDPGPKDFKYVSAKQAGRSRHAPYVREAAQAVIEGVPGAMDYLAVDGGGAAGADPITAMRQMFEGAGKNSKRKQAKGAAAKARGSKSKRPKGIAPKKPTQKPKQRRKR